MSRRACERKDTKVKIGVCPGPYRHDGGYHLRAGVTCYVVGVRNYNIKNTEHSYTLPSHQLYIYTVFLVLTLSY